MNMNVADLVTAQVLIADVNSDPRLAEQTREEVLSPLRAALALHRADRRVAELLDRHFTQHGSMNLSNESPAAASTADESGVPVGLLDAELDRGV